ncbi:hypothetical protein C8J56DRAFT_709959, partial [Mycena floridula]
HRGREKLRMIKKANYAAVVGAKSVNQFWQQIDRLSGPKAGSSEILADELQVTFSGRLNPPEIAPVLFDAVQYRINQGLADQMPSITFDLTPESLFTVPWTDEDVKEVKDHLRENSLKKA